MQFHNERLNQLNYFHDRADEVRTIIRLYGGKNKQLFKKRVSEFLGQDLGDSLKPQDVNATLYQFLTFVFLPFVHFGEVSASSQEASDRLRSEHRRYGISRDSAEGLPEAVPRDLRR